jgi:mannosyltransferase
LIVALLIAGGCFYFLLGHLSHSLWFDESQTATIVSSDGIQQLIQTAMRERPYPPLYFLITRLSWKVESNEFGLRLPSALFGALTVVMLFILGRRMSGVLTGLLAALLLVFSPGMLFYFADANAYALLTLLTTLATYFFYKVWQSNKPMDWLCYSLISLLGLATHQVYIFVLASQGLVGLLFSYPWKQLRAVPLAANLGELWKRRKWFILGLVVLGGCWAGWALFYFSHGGARVPLSIARLWSSATSRVSDVPSV